MEEFLRAYAPVTMARLVSEDMSWHGVDMKADDWVLLPFPAANRDPAQFDRADEVVLDRKVNRHAAFGLGIHRCVGLAPGPDGAAGRPGGLAGAVPGVHAGRPGRGELVLRPDPRPPGAADPARLAVAPHPGARQVAAQHAERHPPGGERSESQEDHGQERIAPDGGPAGG